MVRTVLPSARTLPKRRSAMDRSLANTQSSLVTSSMKVSWELQLLAAGASGITRRSSMPRANSQSWRAPFPANKESCWGETSAIWPIRARPAWLSVFAIAGPTPGSHLFSSGKRNSRSRPSWISMKQDGLLSLLATALTSLFRAIPSDTEIFRL